MRYQYNFVAATAHNFFLDAHLVLDEVIHSHHIGDSTIFSMMHNMSSIGTR